MLLTEEDLQLLESASHPFVKLAWASLISWAKYSHILKLNELPPLVQEALKSYWDELHKPRACFVSIKKDGELRGCIGTIEPQRQNLGDEIIQNTVSAAASDPRFPPVCEGELAQLTLSVDVLTPPVKATMSDLDPKKYGVIVQQGYLKGVLLPDLPGVDTPEDQLRIAAQKAGIDMEAPFDIFVFESRRYW